MICELCCRSIEQVLLVFFPFTKLATRCWDWNRAHGHIPSRCVTIECLLKVNGPRREQRSIDRFKSTSGSGLRGEEVFAEGQANPQCERLFLNACLVH